MTVTGAGLSFFRYFLSRMNETNTGTGGPQPGAGAITAAHAPDPGAHAGDGAADLPGRRARLLRRLFEVTERDLRRAELLSIPLAAIALVLVFGSLVAGFVPVCRRSSVAVTLALMVVVGQVVELSVFV